jgi:hypothetical protein
MNTSVNAGTNSPAIIAGVASVSITEDVNVDSNHRLRANGTLNITDNVIQVLSCVAPVGREHNHPISLPEIAYHIIYYVTSQDHYSIKIAINDGVASGLTVTSLTMQDTCYFSVTTLVSEGRESQFSSEVVITS